MTILTEFTIGQKFGVSNRFFLLIIWEHSFWHSRRLPEEGVILLRINDLRVWFGYR